MTAGCELATRDCQLASCDCQLAILAWLLLWTALVSRMRDSRAALE